MIKNSNRNKVIHKSVFKEVLSKKISLIIITIFFIISFSVVGGSEILSTLGRRSVQAQYQEYNLYQNQFVTRDMEKAKHRDDGPKIPTKGTQVYDDFEKANPKIGENKYINNYKHAFFGRPEMYRVAYAATQLFSDPLAKSTNNSYVQEALQSDIQSYLSELSYKITSYWNIMPNISPSLKNYEFIIKNNINWVTGDYLTSTNFQEDSHFASKKTSTKTKKDINATKYYEGVASDQEFFDKATRIHSSGNKRTYNVAVQKEFLDANNLKVGDKIHFDYNNDFVISASAKFNEVTYPQIGTNYVSNMKDSTFISINLSDFLDFYTRNNIESNQNYSIIDKQLSNIYFGTNNGYNQLNNLNTWNDNSNAFKSITKNYNNFINEVTSLSPEKDDKFKDFKTFYSVNSLHTQSSIWAKTGYIQMKSQEVVINALVFIFVVVFLIVISININRKIKNSVKHLGTLKALGVKEKALAATYIIYPILIICLGFIFVVAFSFPISYLFVNLLKQFYYISFVANPISIGFFLKILIIPLLIAIAWTYFISIRILKKDTLSLINNVENNKPNALVRGLSYFSTVNQPFVLSYTTKGLLKSAGKSSILFLTIFISSFLVAFSMSSTTMIKKEVNEALKNLNIKNISINNIHNDLQYKTEPLYKKEAGQWIKAYADETPIDISAHNMPRYPLILSETEYNDFLDKVDQTLPTNTPLFTYDDKNQSSYNATTGFWENKRWKSNYYFTNKFMTSIVFGYLSALETNPDQLEIWESNRTHKTDEISFTKLESLIKSWEFSLYGNASSAGVDINYEDDDFNDLKKYADIYGSDVTINEQFYNQFNEFMWNTIRVSPYQYALNYKLNTIESNNRISSNHFPISSTLRINYMDNLDAIKNCFGSKGTNIGEKIYNKFKYYQDRFFQPNYSGIDYLPVTISTQSSALLEKGVKEGTIAKKVENGINTYVFSLDNRVLHKPYNSDSYNTANYKILIKIGVINVEYTGIDTKMLTSKPLFAKYLQYYHKYNFDNKVIDYKRNSQNHLVLQKDYVEYYPDPKAANPTDHFQIRLLNDKMEGFQLPLFKHDALIYSKNMPSDATDEMKLYKWYPTASIVMKQFPSMRNQQQTMWNQQWSFTSDDLKIPSGYRNFDVTNGYPFSLETLLNQVYSAYNITMSLFMIISYFSVFIAGIIILIAMLEVINSSKREISMLKIIGYSNLKATTLILAPYILIIMAAFAIAVPLVFLGLSFVAPLLTSLTGNPLTFTLSSLQWALIFIFVFGIVFILFALAYIIFYKTKALKMIQKDD